MKYLIGFIIGLTVAGGVGWAEWGESLEDQQQYMYQQQQWMLQQQHWQQQQQQLQQLQLQHPC